VEGEATGAEAAGAALALALGFGPVSVVPSGVGLDLHVHPPNVAANASGIPHVRTRHGIPIIAIE
jgi:hypothetical protein